MKEIEIDSDIYDTSNVDGESASIMAMRIPDKSDLIQLVVVKEKSKIKKMFFSFSKIGDNA